MCDFAKQIAEADEYVGKPMSVGRAHDNYGEEHIVICMQDEGELYYLDWIGGDYAEGPDECDDVSHLHIHWQPVLSTVN